MCSIPKTSEVNGSKGSRAAHRPNTAQRAGAAQKKSGSLAADAPTPAQQQTKRKAGYKMDFILEATDLKKYYGRKPNITKALDGISIAVRQGEFVSIIDTSGSGKSTLLNMLGGLDVPDSGSVKIRNKEIAEMNDEQLTVFRRRNIGFVFQNYNLVPILNVYQNIVLPIELDGNKIDKPYVDKIINLLHLEEKLDNLPSSLSGGQQQRVAIARALASRPAILLADEPTGNLDSKTSLEVMQLLKMTSTQFGQTLVMITHNSELAQIADRMICIEDGKIAEA